MSLNRSLKGEPSEFQVTGSKLSNAASWAFGSSLWVLSVRGVFRSKGSQPLGDLSPSSKVSAGSRIGRGDVALRFISAITKEVFLHLTGQVLTCSQICQIEPVFIDQHGLVLQPIGPSLFGDAFIDLFAQVARVGRKVQAIQGLVEFDALNRASHNKKILLYKCLYLKTKYPFVSMKGELIH